jgi:hypothetical protein
MTKLGHLKLQLEIKEELRDRIGNVVRHHTQPRLNEHAILEMLNVEIAILYARVKEELNVLTSK